MGKRTTTRHKEDNTFRFQTFEDKLKAISVNVNLSIRDGRTTALSDGGDDGMSTYFHEEVEKWMDLNRTESFADLLCEIGRDINTLPQLVLRKDTLAKILLNHLDNKDNAPSFPPAFALTVALARDLGQEFYPFYTQFFERIVDIVISLKNPEVIEHGFKCYAYLSKYLRRQIVRDMPHHLLLFSPLLNQKLKNYVVIFACEAFEIVVSKYARDHPDKFLDLMFRILLQNKPENVVGLATLLFAMFKGVNGNLKIRTANAFTLESCVGFTFKLSQDAADKAIWMDMMKILVLKLLNYAAETDRKVLFGLFETWLLDPTKAAQIPALAILYKTLVESERCGKIPNVGACVDTINSICTNSNIFSNSSEDEWRQFCELVTNLIELRGKSSNPEILTSLKPSILFMLKEGDRKCIKCFDETLQNTTHYFHTYLSSIIQAFRRTKMDEEEQDNIAVKCISESVINQNGFYHMVKRDQVHLFSGCRSPMWFYGNQKKTIRPLNVIGFLSEDEFKCCTLTSDVVNSLSSSTTNMDNLIRVFLSLSRVSIGECRNCLDQCRHAANIIITHHENCDDENKHFFSMLLLFVLETLVTHSRNDASLLSLEGVNVMQFLANSEEVLTQATAEKPRAFCIWSLKCVDYIVHYAKLSDETSDQRKEILDYVVKLWDDLSSNLQSGFKFVRILTLSIFANILSIRNEESKLTQMCQKFIEIEDTSIQTPTFSPLVKSTLIAVKVLMESGTDELRKFCLKYVMGLMYTNFSLIWSICNEVIQLAGQNIEFSTFWEIFGQHFKMHFSISAMGTLRIHPSSDNTETTNLSHRLAALYFGLPPEISKTLGPFEVLDLTQYSVNLWKSMIGLPFGKQEYSSIRDIVDKTITNSFDASNRTSDYYRQLVPAFQFLEKCELVNSDNQLWNKGLNSLMSTPEIQKAVWEFLHAKRRNKLNAFKPDIDELIKSDSMDCYHKFRVDAIDTTENNLYQNDTSPEKRKVLMEIVLRILIGKERKWKAEKRLQSLRFVGGCTEWDARKYLELTVGTDLNGLKKSPKILEVKINKIASCIRIWRYKFPTLIEELLNLLCDLTSTIKHLIKPNPKYSEEDELPDDVFEEQKKGAIKASRLCLVAFFTFLSKFNLDEKLIDRIFDTFIWTGMEELTSVHSGSKPSWILKLFNVWSTHPRFHILLTKCHGADFEAKICPMQAMFDLLGFNDVSIDLQKFVLGILLNLATCQELEEKFDETEEQEQLELSHKFDGRPLACSGIYPFNVSSAAEEPLGIQIVIHGSRTILKLFKDSQTFKKFVSGTGEGNRCLELIAKLSEFVDTSDEESIQNLSSILIDTLAMHKSNEESLHNSLVACGNLMAKVSCSKALELKLAPTFVWVHGRRLRTDLADILNSERNPDFQLIRDMNSWVTDVAADTPDYSRRQAAFQKLEIHFKENQFDLVLSSLAVANCFHLLLFENDIGMRNSAKNLLVAASQMLSAQWESNSEELKQFLDTAVFPRLRGGIRHKDDNRFADFLQVLVAFVDNGKEVQGTFKELAKVLSSDLSEGLCDIQLHLRTRAMNKLCTNIQEFGNSMSGSVLRNFVLPIATHNLMDEDKLGENRNDLIHSSIETVKTILLLLPCDQYLKFLIFILNSPKKKTRLAKQYERILVAVMDAYHFDLSQVYETEKEVVADKDELENASSENNEVNQPEDDGGGSQEDEDSDVDAEKEKENVPEKVTVSVLSKSAAKKCLNTLKSIVIPKLRQFLNFEEKATHKLSRSEKHVDDDVILRIPCTLALIKLLKKLPKAEGDMSIRTIIPSLCAGLRNTLYSTRHSLRKTILSIIQELGIFQLRVVVKYMKATLQRGYQKHVLNFTVGYFLKCLEPQLRNHPEHFPVNDIIPLCEDELYGIMQEEKELAAIKAKTREAGKSNAYPILKICAKCIQSKSNLSTLIEPAIRQLSQKRSPKVIKTSRQWLTSVSEGIADNVAIDHMELLEWLKEVLSREAGETTSDEPDPKKRKLLVEPVDSFIIPAATSRKTAAADGKLTGKYLLTEFVFNSLYSGLNKSTRLKEALIRSMSFEVLDDFVEPLTNGLTVQSKQVNTVALRCLTLLFEFDLYSFRKDDLVDRLRRNGFLAMNNHCYLTISDSQMSNATFKFLTAFFLRFADYKIVLQDFELLLKCIQSYLTNEECSSAAITLLKGVLKNKYKSSHLQELMEEVFKQGIRSLYQHINEGCRQAYLVYLNNYCTNLKELTSQVRLILNQFDYSIENGRLTAVEIMNSLLEFVPEKCLEEIKELVFLKTLSCLDKETQKPVRSKLAEVVKTLLKNETKKSLFSILLKLMSAKNHLSELDTFFLVAGVVVEDFSLISDKEFEQLLIKIEETVNSTAFQELCLEVGCVNEQAQDYAIFQALTCLKKGINRRVGGHHIWERKCSVSSTTENILDHLKGLLFYEHEWVPPVTIDILFHVFTQLEQSANASDTDGDSNWALAEDSIIIKDTDELRQLIKNIWSILKSTEEGQRDETVMKGTLLLVQLTCMASRLRDTSIFAEAINEIKKSINHEVVRDPKNMKTRLHGLACLRSILSNSDHNAIVKVSETVTRLAVREITDEGVQGTVKMEAEKLTAVLRSELGNATFNAIYAKMNDFYHKKRNLNRAKKKESFVLHPEIVRKRKKVTSTNESKAPFKKLKRPRI